MLMPMVEKSNRISLYNNSFFSSTGNRAHSYQIKQNNIESVIYY